MEKVEKVEKTERLWKSVHLLMCPICREIENISGREDEIPEKWEDFRCKECLEKEGKNMKNEVNKKVSALDFRLAFMVECSEILKSNDWSFIRTKVKEHSKYDTKNEPRHLAMREAAEDRKEFLLKGRKPNSNDERDYWKLFLRLRKERE